MNAAFRLAVLNASGRDPEQDFAAGPPPPGAPGHSPMNFHAYAACARGSFHRDEAAALATGRPILLLLRRDLKASWRALSRLKAAGRTVAVTFKEAGATQVADRLTNPAAMERLSAIVALADGCLAPTPWLAAFFESLLPPGRRAPFIPTPYPLGDSDWDFARPPADRQGVLVGTREFETPSRQHLAAVLAARRMHELTGERVTVFNADGRRGARMLAALGFSAAETGTALRTVTAPLPYPTYLREVAGHRLVFQLDRSGVPGQVAGDALLCGIPCVGGDGATEQAAFAPWCGVGRSAGELGELALALLRESESYASACRESQAAGRAHLGNEVIAERLAEYFGTLRG